MKLTIENYGSLEEPLWDEGFVPFPVKTDGKSPFIPGITGINGAPPTELERERYRADYSYRNVAITGYLHSDGVRREDEIILTIDVDDETGQAFEELKKAVGEDLSATVSVTGQGGESHRRKYLFRVKGSHHSWPSKIMGGRIDICDDVKRCTVVGGTHVRTGKRIEAFGPDRAPLERPLRLSDIANAPRALVNYLDSLGTKRAAADDQNPCLTAEAFLESLDSREPSYFVVQFLNELTLNRDFGNEQLYTNLKRLVELQNIAEHGTQVLYDELHWCWHARDHVSGDAEKEWSHALDNAAKIHWFGESGVVLDFTYREMMLGWIEEAVAALEAVTLEERFGTVAKGRSLIEHCYEVARITGDRPIALVAAVLIQVNNEIPYTVKIKSSLGEEVLNQVLVVSGGTGTGKSAVLKNSESPLYWSYPRLRAYFGPTEPVSGEGANMAFMRELKGKRGQPCSYEWRYPERNEVFLFDEVGLVESRDARQGSTLSATVLVHHSGSHISRAKADGSVMTMPAGSYKVNWVIGTQPKRSDFFFNDNAVAAGLAGRCLWVPVTIEDDGQGIDDEWDYSESYEIEPHEVVLPDWGHASSWRPTFIEPTEELHRELRRARRLGQLGRVNPLESHSVRNKARLAAILAIADNRLHMNDDDVELAEILTQISRRTYQEALAELQEYQASKNASAGRSDGVRRHFGARRQRELDVKHHAQRIRQKLLALCGDDPMTIRHLRQVRNTNFKGTTRDEYWEDAVEYLASMADLPEQLREISSHEEIRVRESEANMVNNQKENND